MRIEDIGRGMRMSRKFKYFGIVWAVLFVLFQAITFIVPNEIMGTTRFDKPTFWIAYVFVCIAFVGNLAVTYAFANSKNTEKAFLHIPLLYVGYGSLAISAVVGTVFMVIPKIPAWIGGAVCLVVFAAFALAYTLASAASDSVSAVGKEVKDKTAFMREITVHANNLTLRATSDPAKAAAKQVYEALRYSDTVSAPGLEAREELIRSAFDTFSQAVLAEDLEGMDAAKAELLLLIQERNNACKLLK